MNELAHSISLLFEPDSAPVVAVSGGCILFFNPAALRLFPTLEYGMKASSVLPAAFIDCDENVFISTALIDRQPVSACGTWYNGMLLLRMNIAPDLYVFAPEALASSMRLELANMKMALDLLQSKVPAGDSNDLPACLSVLYHGYYKLLRRCENLSLAAQLLEHEVVYRPTSLELTTWLKRLIELVKESAAGLGISIQLTCPNEMPSITADPELLEYLILNLLSNSLRHCAPGSSISLRLTKKGSRILLTVDDGGAGFSGDLLGCLFQRQIDAKTQNPSRADQMGLYIVWGISQLHGGSVTVTNRRKGGASVRISLPVSGKETLRLHTPTSEYSGANSAMRRILTALADVLPAELYSNGLLA